MFFPLYVLRMIEIAWVGIEKMDMMLYLRRWKMNNGPSSKEQDELNGKHRRACVKDFFGCVFAYFVVALISGLFIVTIVGIIAFTH